MTLHDSQSERTIRFEAARQIITDAGQLAHDYFDRYRMLDVEEKTSGQDIVSIADRAVEDFIRDAIRGQFPDDGIIGEEHGGDAGVSRFQWLVDPIDGTGCFLHGLRTWTVVIAIMEGGEPVSGLILEPCTGRLYWARKGHGAFCGDAPISVDAKTPFSGGLFAVGSSTPELAPHIGSVVTGVLANGGTYMRNGSAALALAHVAAGHYLGFYEPVLNAWDCVAGLLIVSEAGGMADDFLAGGDIHATHPCFAATPAVCDQFRAIIAADGD